MPQSTVLRSMLLLTCLFPCLVARAQLADLPPVGRSLFDHLTIDGRGVQRVPFPFTALMERVQRDVGADALGHAGVRAVLIPLGRSLQRNASVTEAYRYPRIVAAVTGEPKPGAPLLRDRLYLGYHEKAGVLEVISYNEAAGRFEFQVVKDYRTGSSARVYQSRRVVCLSCHHNAAPIFSRPGWDETNANPRVAAQLRRGGSDFHGVPATRSIDEPNAIDNAVARANRLEIAQRIWREGCAPADAVDCRAQALLSALKYRLGADVAVDADAETYRVKLLAALRAAGQTRWPDGLPVADPNISNRDPLASFPVARADFGDSAALMRTAEVRPAFDPLQPRPPLGRWNAGSEADVAGYVRSVAEFLASTDIQAIDRRLRVLRTNTSRRMLRATCRVERSAHGSTLHCASSRSASQLVQAEIHLVRDDGGAATGRVSGMSVAGARLARSLEIAPVGAFATRTLRATWTSRGSPVRLSDATAIERLLLHLGAGGESAEVELLLADDTPILARAIDGLSRQAQSGLSDALGEAPIRRGALMRGLFAQLGVAAPPACCDQPLRAAQPAFGVDDAPSYDGLPAQLQTFVRHCAACHGTRENSPPGFLHGNADEVRRSLTRCAERISYRLAMWEKAPEQRSRLPMPPPLVNGVIVPPPPREELAQMRGYLAQLAGPAVQYDVPYEALAACRPDSP